MIHHHLHTAVSATDNCSWAPAEQRHSSLWQTHIHTPTKRKRHKTTLQLVMREDDSIISYIRHTVPVSRPNNSTMNKNGHSINSFSCYILAYFSTFVLLSKKEISLLGGNQIINATAFPCFLLLLCESLYQTNYTSCPSPTAVKPSPSFTPSLSPSLPKSIFTQLIPLIRLVFSLHIRKKKPDMSVW